MKNSQNKKRLQIVLLVLIAVLTLGIGYASISVVNLIINGNATGTVAQENFKVYFVPTADTPSLTGNVTLTGSATIDSEDNTIAHFNVSGLTKVGDYVIATYTIINNSEAIGADISLQLTNSNTEYFKVTETVSDTELQAGDTTTGTIKVEMIKTPIEANVSTNVTGILTASPLENASATGGGAEEEIRPVPDPYTYTINGLDVYTNLNISDWTRTYNNFVSAKTAFGYPAVLAHKIEDSKVAASYIAFERNGEVYYLRGGANNEQASISIFEDNVAILKKAFGGDGVWETYCSEYDDHHISCLADGIYYQTGTNGHNTQVGSSGWSCFVDYWGFSRCSTY